MKTRTVDHSLLDKAKANKKDEFYTQMEDIEKELAHYTKHFENKTVYCNCDDPRVSNFWNYFYGHFHELKLKGLYATFYGTGAYFCKYDGKAVTAAPLLGNGDFRSDECAQILKQNDIVVTTPPFSLFREYIRQLDSHGKDFLVIISINALTYKEVFPLIKANKAWLGVCFGRGISGFIVPESYELYGTEAKINGNGDRVISPNNCMGLTTLDNEKRHPPLIVPSPLPMSSCCHPHRLSFHALAFHARAFHALSLSRLSRVSPEIIQERGVILSSLASMGMDAEASICHFHGTHCGEVNGSRKAIGIRLVIPFLRAAAVCCRPIPPGAIQPRVFFVSHFLC